MESLNLLDLLVCFSSCLQLCLGTFDHWQFSFMPLNVVWALSIVKVFSISLALASNIGCDPSQCYFKKTLLGLKGDCKGYILASWKDYRRWPFFIQTHVFRINKSCFHVSMQNPFSLFIQMKLDFGVTSWCSCFLFFFVRYFRYMVTFLKNHLNF